MICGHCKSESKDLELFERNGTAAYTCAHCRNFFTSFDKVLADKRTQELMDRLAEND